MTQVNFPPKVSLAHTPTPLQRLERLSSRCGADIWVKRDDLTGCGLSGNKVRKLEYVLAQALAQKADTVITCGKIQSNLARATAVACARLGLKCHLVLRFDGPGPAPELCGNYLLDRLVGAEVEFVDADGWDNRDQIMAHRAGEMKNKGRSPYILPYGASTALGALGVVEVCGELRDDLAQIPGGLDEPLTIFTATGSGGTLAGLAMGVRLYGLNARVAGINVDDFAHNKQSVDAILAEAKEGLGIDHGLGPGEGYLLIDGYVGRGYALSTPEELDFVAMVARMEGLILDPVYTGKTLRAVTLEIKAHPDEYPGRIVFLHSGGIFHLFSHVPGLDQLLLQH
jgi:D-cysteine desulfhydrase